MEKNHINTNIISDTENDWKHARNGIRDRVSGVRALDEVIDWNFLWNGRWWLSSRTTKFELNTDGKKSYQHQYYQWYRKWLKTRSKRYQRPSFWCPGARWGYWLEFPLERSVMAIESCGLWRAGGAIGQQECQKVVETLRGAAANRRETQ